MKCRLEFYIFGLIIFLAFIADRLCAYNLPVGNNGVILKNNDDAATAIGFDADELMKKMSSEIFSGY